MSREIYEGPRPVAKEPFIVSGSVSCPALTETLLVRRRLRNGMTPKLTKFGLAADAGGTGNLTIRRYVNGVRQLSGDLTELVSSYSGGGGEPIAVDPPIEFPPDAEIEWRCYNAHATDAFAVEVKALVEYFQ